MLDPYHNQQIPGYLLQRASNQGAYAFMPEYQQSDRELDRERRLRYLERKSQDGYAVHPPQAAARSDSMELTYEVLYQHIYNS